MKALRGKLQLATDNSVGDPALLDTLDRALMLLKRAKTTPEGRPLRKIVIVIEYGYAVYTVCEQVRAKVIEAVESLLGLDVTAVDIVVDDIHIDDSRLAKTAAAKS